MTCSSCLRNFFCCQWSGCCSTFADCLHSIFCCGCFTGQARRPPPTPPRAYSPPMPIRVGTPPAPERAHRSPAHAHRSRRRASPRGSLEDIRLQTISPRPLSQLPPPAAVSARRPKATTDTIAPLPSLPFEVADRVDAHQKALAAVGRRVAAWLDDGEDISNGNGGMERYEQQEALMREVERLEAPEKKIGRAIATLEEGYGWMKEAKRRRVGLVDVLENND
ncbi:hypothetical protein EDC01DRAFT_243433 [Geopyxis carbonaria]|nr:hypothetical protein EDC01DRAFT_243433 [Geopyxis carbonaria]